MVSVAVNLASTTGTTVRSTIYGFACSELQMNGFQPTPRYEAAANSTFQSLASQLNISFIRHNWDNDRPPGFGLASGLAIMDQIFTSRGASPNFSIFDNWLNNAAKFLNVKTCSQMICIGAPSWLNLSNSNDRTLLGQQVVQVAQHCFAKGFPCYYWEPFNEANGVNNMTDQVAASKAIATALSGYNDGTGNAHHVGGPTDDFPYGDRITSFSNGMASQLGFLAWHRYSSGATGSESPTANMNDALGWASLCTSVNSASGRPGTPQALTEHNVSFNGSDPDNGTYVGAVHSALSMYACATSGANFQFAGLWELFGDSNFGIIPSNGDNTAPAGNIRPTGYLNSQCASWMGGSQVATSGATGSLVCFATKTATSYTVQLINYGSTSVSVNLSISGATQSTYNYWEIGNNFRNTPNKTTISNLTNITVPNTSVVMISTQPFTGVVPTVTPSPNNTTVPPAASITGIDGTIWTILGDGTVGTNGISDVTTSNVVELAFVNSQVWQKNASGLWWAKTFPSDTWLPGSGTTVDPTTGLPPAPPVVPPVSGNILSFDFTSNTGQAISPFLWGAATEGLNSPGVNDYGAALNAGFQTTYRAQNWRLFRFNTAGTISDWINKTTSSRNWFTGSASFWDNVNNRLVFTLGSATHTVSPTQAVAIAQDFIDHNQECAYWEYWNEPDQDGVNVGTWQTNFIAIRNALKAFNPNYKVGAPVTSFVVDSFMASAASAGVDFISFHSYPGGGNAAASADALISQGISRAKSDIIAARTHFANNIPIFLGEYSSSFNGNEPLMQQVPGAVFAAMYLFTSFDNDPGKNVDSGAIWTIGQNSQFTFVNNDGTNIRPVGYYLGYSGKVMAGSRIAVVKASNLTKMAVFATQAGINNAWAIQIINYDSTSTPVSLQGVPAGDATYWEVSSAHPTTATQTMTTSQGMNLSIPAMSVVILSGAGILPAPPPVVPPGVTPSQNGTQVPPWTSITGIDGTIWSILPNGDIAVNGNDDGQSSNVVELAYINGQVWQKNSSNLWWAKTFPSDTWLPGSGTTVDPTIGIPSPPAPTPPPPIVPPPIVPPPIVPPPVVPPPPVGPPPVILTRNYFDIPGGDGSSGTAGGPSVWVTPLGDGASWGLASDADTISLRHGGSIRIPNAGGEVIWFGQQTDPFTTFVTAADAYQRDPALSVTLHVPTGAYPSGPSIGATFGQNSLNVYDTITTPQTSWSFLDINVATISGGQTVFASFAELDNPTSDHYGEDQETGNFGYNAVAGMLTAYDFDPTRNLLYPKIQHMLRYTIDPQYLKSGNLTGGDDLPVTSWPQKKQDPQTLPYTGSLIAGTTIGIPLSTPMPLGLTPEGEALFWTLQHYGALWRGSSTGGLTFSASQDVDPTVLSNLNRDLPTIVQLLCPLRNQHVGGQPFTSSPKNGPGTRVDTGPPRLATSAGVPTPAPPVPTAVGPVVPVFAQYWAALMSEVAQNTDMLYGVMINSGDPQGSSGVADTGVINTPAAPVIGASLAPVRKA